MTRQLIAVDVDDVLADSAAGFVAFSNERWGCSLTIADYDERWNLLWQTDQAETERRAIELHESGVFGRFTHNETALPTLIHLAERYDLSVVTSRRGILEPETLAWLDEHFNGIFGNVHFAGMWDEPDRHSYHATKADVLDRIGADYLVDDQLKHCIGAADIGVQAVLFGNYGWNQVEQMPQGVTRAADWAAVKVYFDGC